MLVIVLFVCGVCVCCVLLFVFCCCFVVYVCFCGVVRFLLLLFLYVFSGCFFVLFCCLLFLLCVVRVVFVLFCCCVDYCIYIFMFVVVFIGLSCCIWAEEGRQHRHDWAPPAVAYPPPLERAQLLHWSGVWALSGRASVP